jgi:hypothetical protein
MDGVGVEGGTRSTFGIVVPCGATNNARRSTGTTSALDATEEQKRCRLTDGSSFRGLNSRRYWGLSTTRDETRAVVVVVVVNRGRAWSSVDLILTKMRGSSDIQLLSRRFALEGARAGSCTPPPPPR